MLGGVKKVFAKKPNATDSFRTQHLLRPGDVGTKGLALLLVNRDGPLEKRGNRVAPRMGLATKRLMLQLLNHWLLLWAG